MPPDPSSTEERQKARRERAHQVGGSGPNGTRWEQDLHVKAHLDE